MRGIGPMLQAIFNQLRSRSALVELIVSFVWSRISTMMNIDLSRPQEYLQPGDNGAAIRDAVNFSRRRQPRALDQPFPVLVSFL
jgi:hypothetical protein